MIYLIPTFLSEDAMDSIPGYVLSAIRDCQVIFAEDERTVRRFFKALSKEIVIDDYQWYTTAKAEAEQIAVFRKWALQGKNIGIVSEAGCPGVADPGQILVAEAHKMNIVVKPLVGPNSILLALMASGLNGQCFTFHGYLPIETGAQIKKIKQLEEHSAKNHCTQIFIETPYRNNRLMKSLIDHCQPATLLCVGAELTSKDEWIATRTIKQWRENPRDLHKKAAIFLLQVPPRTM
jgi:16S rRNA (cytidine1402-2'-O)-methyltransferase